MLLKNDVQGLIEKYADEEVDLASERQRTRDAYNTKEGREQFVRLLVNLKQFSKLRDEKDIALYNLGISILEDMGVLDEENIQRIVDFFFTLPLV